ncbi:nitroreductase family deazaflavin-dependent oxidoreductase [Nocardia sp. NPDC050406]|uniref:nitroreductase family deazaflavin-dependent oxidoreductase n=1 Tax=Nocardia sp. NPDC050406 TaxID=3364318 RepID=UPI0037B880DC
MAGSSRILGVTIIAAAGGGCACGPRRRNVWDAHAFVGEDAAMPLPQALARLNRSVTNPVLGVMARYAPGFGIVVHTGRNSGRTYRAPVAVFERDGGYRIALTYGRDVDWLKNIRAAGKFDFETRGRTVTLTEIVVGRDASASWAPLGVRQALVALRAEYYVQARAAR